MITLEHLKAEAPDIIKRAVARGQVTLADPNQHVNLARAQRTKRAIARHDTKSHYYIPPIKHTFNGSVITDAMIHGKE